MILKYKRIKQSNIFNNFLKVFLKDDIYMWYIKCETCINIFIIFLDTRKILMQDIT